MVKFNETTAKSGATSGCEKNEATAPAESTPTTVHRTPSPRLVQKTVDRSISLILRRWISAEPSEGSAKIVASPVKTSAMPARPYSCGVSRCASRTPKITRVPRVATCVTSFQPTPRTTELRRLSVGSSSVSATSRGSVVRASGSTAIQLSVIQRRLQLYGFMAGALLADWLGTPVGQDRLGCIRADQVGRVGEALTIRFGARLLGLAFDVPLNRLDRRQCSDGMCGQKSAPIGIATSPVVENA